MARTIEEIISDSVGRAVADRIRPLEKRIMEIMVAIDKLSDMATVKQEEPAVRLITKAEARKRLKVSAAKFNELIHEGCIDTARTPEGRNKVIEKSLNKYIEKLATKGAA